MPLYRSWLFVPGNQERRLEKAKTLSADVLIYDLEDAVPVKEKLTARLNVEKAIKANNQTKVFVRVNDMSTAYFGDDIKAVVTRELSGIMLPKAEDEDDIFHIDHLLTNLEKRKDLTKSIEVIPLIESARGLLNAYQIAIASKRVKRLAFGSVDFTLDINAQLSKSGKEIMYARSELIVISRAASIEPPIDGVFTHIKDDEGLRKDIQFAKQLGFQGKLAVHPTQINPINELFSPTPEEINTAEKVVMAFEKALSAGLAAVEVQGKMVDYPVVEQARRILAKANRMGRA